MGVEGQCRATPLSAPPGPHTLPPFLPAPGLPPSPAADTDTYTIVYDPNTRDSTEEPNFDFTKATEVRLGVWGRGGTASGVTTF